MNALDRTALLARARKLPASDLTAAELLQLARMVRDCDLIHVDEVPAWVAKVEQQRLHDEMSEACREAGRVA
jgi:ABC-type ATPase with predicted acetyltransferase domain